MLLIYKVNRENIHFCYNFNTELPEMKDMFDLKDP